MKIALRKNEHALQVACVRWIRARYPRLIIFAIPNGGARDAVTGARLKAEGATAGVPYLCVPLPRGGFSALYIEMKDGDTRVSAAQKEIIETLEKCGNKCVVCRSFDDFVASVTDYLNR